MASIVVLAKNCGQFIFSENLYFMACSKLEKDITLTCCVVEKFFHEINKTKNIKMHQVFVANLSNSVRVQKLNFAYKESLG